MSNLQAIVLSIVQGVTEFLPISSDGHLVLVPWLLGWETQSLAFDAAVHLGTLGAVIIFFRREWAGLMKGLVRGTPVRFGTGDEAGSIKPWPLVILLGVALVPTAVIGLLLRQAVEGPLRKPEWAAVFLICTGALMLAGELAGKRMRKMDAATLKDSAMMGVAQGLAVLPGLSRSGSTIASGLITGLSREAAARLSFLMAVPAIAGAGVFVLAEMATSDHISNPGITPLVIGAVGSFITGIFALGLLMLVVRKASLKPFVAYTLFVGIGILVARAAGA